MKPPILDNRDSSGILADIKYLVKSYLPEWNFSLEYPDFGVAIAKIYSDMMTHTINLYNRTPNNHYLAFLNLLDAKILPPTPASGLITIKARESAKDGIYIEKGSLVYASADNEEGRVFYQISDGIHVDTVQIEHVICTNGTTDCVTQVDAMEDFYAFDTILSENLQKHILYFCDNIVFDCEGKSDIGLQINNAISQRTHSSLPAIFLNATFEYFAGDGWNQIRGVELDADNYIRLRFTDTMKPVLIGEKEGLYIRCRFDVIPQSPLAITDVKCKSFGKDILPTAMSCGDDNLKMFDFFPFDEKFDLNDCFFICCNHVFRKKNAEILINFDISTMKCKSDLIFTPLPIKYKNIMSLTDFESKPPQHISIKKVIWEYFNDNGWVRLFPSDKNEDFFSDISYTGESLSLKFIVPLDLNTSSHGGVTGYFVRARITKINNPYSYDGDYIAPFIKSIKLDYHYNEYKPTIKEIIVDSNLVEKRVIIEQNQNIPLLKNEILSQSAMYFVLSKGLSQGPIRILFNIEKNTFKDRPRLRWEYYACDKENKGCWKNIDIADGTKDLSTTAIITIMGKKDFLKGSLFGITGYFIRIVNVDNRYQSILPSQLPYIKSIDINTVEILQKTNQPIEYFFVEKGEKNIMCKLVTKYIYEIDLWVEEKDFLTVDEFDSLVAKGNLQLEYDSSNQVSRAWVRWNEVENLLVYDGDARVYRVDYINSTVSFGDGIYGKIPIGKIHETIKVEYSVTEGIYGNIGKNEILGFANAMPHIHSVENFNAIVGAVEKETINQVSHRMSSKLSSSDRLVTLEDYENLIINHERRIKRVKCISHIDRFQKKKTGLISIAILPNDYLNGGEQFASIEESLREYIFKKSGMFENKKGLLDIFEVTYVEMNLTITVAMSDYNDYHQICQDITHKLDKFLDPIDGNFNGSGFEIGNLPNSQLIYNCIVATENIKMIKRMSVFTSVFTKEGKKEIDFLQAKKNIFAVPIFGQVEIESIIN